MFFPSNCSVVHSSSLLLISLGPFSSNILIAFAASMSYLSDFAIHCWSSVSIKFTNSPSGNRTLFSLSWSSSGHKSSHLERESD